VTLAAVADMVADSAAAVAGARPLPQGRKVDALSGEAAVAAEAATTPPDSTARTAASASFRRMADLLPINGGSGIGRTAADSTGRSSISIEIS
jgi:hypothetical protein